MKVSSFSIGSVPSHNEDCLKYENMGISGYAVVIADGMGGLPHGEVCATIISHIQANYKDFHSEFRILKTALEKADSTIAVKGVNKYKCPMGTTIAAAIVTDYKIFYTWQGNVRIYLRQNGILKLLTIDHTLDIGYASKELHVASKERDYEMTFHSNLSDYQEGILCISAQMVFTKRKKRY